MEQALPVRPGQLEVRCRRLSSHRKLFDGLAQNRIAAVLVQMGSSDPRIKVLLVPEQLSRYRATEFAFETGRFASIGDYFRLPDGSAEIMSGSKELSDLPQDVLDPLADQLKLIRDPEAKRPTRRFHALSPLEDTRIRYPVVNGGSKWRWTSGSQRGHGKDPTLLIQDVNEDEDVAYGFYSPDRLRVFTDLVSIPLKNLKSVMLEQPGAWDFRCGSAKRLPFTGGSDVRRVGNATMMVVNDQNGLNGETRLLTLLDDGSIQWSGVLPDQVLGRYYLDGKFGLVTTSPDKRTFRIIPPLCLRRYLTGPRAVLAAYLKD